MSDGFLATYLPYLLRRTDQALSAEFYQSLTAQGIQRSDWRVLAVLREGGSMSMSHLTATALAPQPTVSHAVARLARQGLVERVHDRHDKRRRFVALTRRGESLADLLVAEADLIERKLLDMAGIDDIDNLIDQLRHLHTILSGEAAVA